MITLKDIADRTGFSEMTVSRALRKQKHVSDATREKIERVAKELGHQTDPMLSALVHYREHKQTNKTFNKIAIISAWPLNNNWPLRDASGKRVMEGIQSAASLIGFDVELFVLENYAGNLERLKNILRARGIEDLLLLPLPYPAVSGSTEEEEDWEGFHVVRIGGGVGYPHYQYVRTDHYASVITQWDQLWARKYRRIGLAVTLEGTTRAHGLWEAAFLYQKKQKNLKTSIPLYIEMTSNKEAFLTYVATWCLDAVMLQRSHFVKWLQELGDSRKGGVAHTSLNGHTFPQETSGIYQRRSEIGRTAVHLLHR